ncbi:phospholipase D family protein [Pontibacter amylolyticus]|uniref:Phospholipase D-like domain-containing protein n=1 Tax=Pontibacter amylolyticus TaxID=1424080 RepID=A0ABQ1W4I6_9BACT|nr:phospholipase D family protein [Pontibacter amylolyticus]GGG14692.1 hypothetical protein GCM10011323_18890 [Pontibacter amylolyticus]
MSKFITGKELEKAVDKIIWQAEDQLVIVSPYIKLDNHFKKLFEKHESNPKLHIVIIFGKNEGQVGKSLNKSDLEYFKQFPKISIVYVPNLHAKYYANEYMGLLTSINLYDYSFINNIEFGVLYERKLINFPAKSADDEAWETCWEIAQANEVIFVKRPFVEKNFFGLNKTYKKSKVLLDRIDELYSGKPLTKSTKRLDDFEGELNSQEEYAERPIREEVVKPASPVYFEKNSFAQKSFEPGYCIRTGEKIPFNPERPLSYQAFKSWSQFGNEDYEERFCHYSGEPSNGETSVRRPILRKNWKQAQQAEI